MKISEAQAVLRAARKQYGNVDLLLGDLFTPAQPVAGVCVTSSDDQASVLLWIQQGDPTGESRCR